MNPNAPPAAEPVPSLRPGGLRERVATWDPDQHPWWLRALVALAITSLAAWMRVALAPAESGGRFITLSLAAALCALYGGFRIGMLSTLLGMLFVNYLLVKPYFSFAFADPREAFWLNLWHLITQLVVVGADATTTLQLCGKVTAFVAATSSSHGSMTLAGQHFVIAKGTVLPTAVKVGADLCATLQLNLFAQVKGATATANVNTVLEVCGQVTAYAAAGATTAGSITVAGITKSIAPGTTIAAQATGRTTREKAMRLFMVRRCAGPAAGPSDHKKQPCPRPP